MKKVFDFIDGKKTYIVAAATVVYAAVGYALGYIPMEHAVELVLGAFGLGALRHGMEKTK